MEPAAGLPGEALAESGAAGYFHTSVIYEHMAVTDRNDALVEVFRSKAVLVGSCTVNNGLLPSLMPILEEIKGLKFKNKIGAAFGSYGWSGEGVKLLEQHLQACKIPPAAPGVMAKWQPTADDLEKCKALGRDVAKAVLA